MTDVPGIVPEAVPGGHVCTFTAMGSPCEVRIETDDIREAARVGDAVAAEARRIEARFSRYRDDSVVSAINRRAGELHPLDPETAALIDYAAQCHRLSGGRFDITSGILRRAWTFDGSDRVPDATTVSALMDKVGWHKVEWERPVLRLQPGMQIDLGGLGKEYAVDTAMGCAGALTASPLLINFGGDLRVSGPRRSGDAWRVAIEGVDETNGTEGMLELRSGALTTSGDDRRFLMKDGQRYSHILDPRTGWPVHNPPRSVTVAAPTCIEAGFLSTLAMLQGADAETFLQQEQITAWWLR